MPDNKATIDLVFVTAKPDYRVIKDLLTIKKDKILKSSQQLSYKERSLNRELLNKNKAESNFNKIINDQKNYCQTLFTNNKIYYETKLHPSLNV